MTTDLFGGLGKELTTEADTVLRLHFGDLEPLVHRIRLRPMPTAFVGQSSEHAPQSVVPGSILWTLDLYNVIA